MKCLVAFVFWIICCIVQHGNAEDAKIWTSTTNFDDPRNWEDGRLPCANDRIIFTAPVVSFMPSAVSFAQMVLPIDGGIIFPENAVIMVTGGNQQRTCVGKDVYFKSPVDFWYNPSNWNLTSDRAFPGFTGNAAVPHAFRVPCRTDSVIFPPKISFKVNVDHSPTTVASLQINNVDYTNEEFQGLLQSHTGRLLFPDSPSIVITGAGCTKQAGCVCGNDQPTVLSKICAHQNSCPVPKCSEAIKPIGHCCLMCGATLTMGQLSDFKMTTLLQMYQDVLREPKFQAVQSYTVKTFSGEVQSVFTDDGTDDRSSEVAEKIYQDLLQDTRSDRSYKVHSVLMFKSGRRGPGNYESLVSSGLSSGGVAAIFIAIIAIAASAAAVYVYKKRNIPGFSFARFDLRGDKIELELGTTPHEELEPDSRPTTADGAKSFDNPVYGSLEGPDPSSGAVESEKSEKNFIENPMFAILEESPKKHEMDF